MSSTIPTCAVCGNPFLFPSDHDESCSCYKLRLSGDEQEVNEGWNADKSSQASGWVPCPKCGKKTMLCTGMCNTVTPDQEPYVSGEIEDTEYGEDGIFVEIWVSCHCCEHCNAVFSVGIESPQEDAPNSRP